MKNTIIVLSIIISLLSNNIFGQNSSDKVFGVSVNIGLPTEVTSGSSTFPINIAVAFERKFNNKWALEGQLSGAYLAYDRGDGIEHDGGYQAYTTLSVGTRYYWNSAVAKHPIYTNALIGGGQWFEEEYNADNEFVDKNSGTVILSSGTYISINNKFIAGLSFDATTGNEEAQIFLSAKIGYNF